MCVCVYVCVACARLYVCVCVVCVCVCVCVCVWHSTANGKVAGSIPSVALEEVPPSPLDTLTQAQVKQTGLARGGSSNRV